MRWRRTERIKSEPDDICDSIYGAGKCREDNSAGSPGRGAGRAQGRVLPPRRSSSSASISLTIWRMRVRERVQSRRVEDRQRSSHPIFTQPMPFTVTSTGAGGRRP